MQRGVQVEDAGSGQKINIEKRAFPDVVLWNPWSTKAKEMSDFGDEEYKVLRQDRHTPSSGGEGWVHVPESCYVFVRRLCQAAGK